jgi:phage portal protein BeeE
MLLSERKISMLKELGAFIRKLSGARIFTWPNRYLSEQAGSHNTLAGHVVTPENCLGSSAVASCVRLLSDTIAALPVHVYRDLGRSKEIAVDHPLYDLLHSKPNEFMTSFTWMQQAITHCLLHGNHYSFIERNAAGDPCALWPLNPDGMIVEAVDGIVSYRYMYAGVRNTFAFDDVLHFKGLTMNGLVGLSVCTWPDRVSGYLLLKRPTRRASFAIMRGLAWC